MSITYTVGDFTDSDSKVEVTYTDEQGFEHKRTINLPRLEDGSLDQEYYDRILESQLRNVINKLKLGVISFKDPSATEEEQI